MRPFDESAPARAITDFSQDAGGHWVATLACGHRQHVRHEPPLQDRRWVLTAEGRASHVGTTLGCMRCLDGEPAPLHATALSASFTVANLAASLAWYRDVLGFAVDQLYERGGALRAASLRAGAARILLGQDDGAKGLDRVKGEGFSLMLTTTQDVDAIARRVRELGGTLDSEPADTPWGARAFRLRDPDGFRFTIASERSRTP